MAADFVIQSHTGYGPPHLDLMLRRGEALATWQLPSDPATLVPGQSLPARRLSDHRLDYLTYEGPVSGGRGEVRILDRGTFEMLGETECVWTVHLAGERTRGAFRLRREGTSGDDWTLERPAERA